MKDLTQLAESYRRVWDGFQRAATTADGRHDTDAWRAHGGPYAACIIRVDANALQPTLDELRRNLSSLGNVRLHPDPFLHIMLQELGFIAEVPSGPHEITRARLEEFAQAAIEPASSLRPIALTLGGANAFHDAVFLEVGGAHVLSRLHERLFELAAIPQVPEYPYLPHCTIAHFVDSSPAREAQAVISPWRGQHFGELLVTEIEIVTFSAGEAYPDLETYAAIPLG